MMSRPRRGPGVGRGCRPADAFRSTSISASCIITPRHYDQAAAAFEQVLKIDPNNVDAMVMLAETRNGQGRTAEAVTMIQKAIAARIAAGQKADETWYKRAVALAFNAKLPTAANSSPRLGRRLSEPQELARHDPHLPDDKRARRCVADQFDAACAGNRGAGRRE